MKSNVDYMPNYIEISPSSESKRAPLKPVTVINRLIAIDQVVKMHRHSWGQFLYASKGVLSVVTPTDRYIVPPEQGVWLPPQVSHEVTAITDVELTSYYFDNTSLTGLPSYCCVLLIDHFLQSLIVESKKCSSTYQEGDVDRLLLKLIHAKLCHAQQVSFQLPYPKDSRLLTMLSMMQKEPSKTLTLNEWGKIVGASNRTLSRLFKVETGLTYSQWRQRLMVQMAITQLGKGNAIASIAMDLGYESTSAFCYMFKENTGVTPSVYRLRS